MNIAEKKWRCQVRTQVRGHLIDKQDRAGAPARSGWRRTQYSGGRTLCRRRAFPRKVSPAEAHLHPLQVPSTSCNSRKLDEHGGLLCTEEGCGLRMCHSAHHGNCNLLINECGCEPTSSQARRSFSFFHHEGDGEVSEASSELTDLVMQQLLLRRSFQKTFTCESHAKAVSLNSSGVTCFSEICSVSDLQSLSKST